MVFHFLDSLLLHFDLIRCAPQLAIPLGETNLSAVTAEQIIGLIVALIFMLTGSVASMIPGIPGTPIVLLTAILHRVYFGAASVNNWVLAGLILLTLISVVLDYIASMI